MNKTIKVIRRNFSHVCSETFDKNFGRSPELARNKREELFLPYGSFKKLSTVSRGGVQIIQMINELSRNGMMKGTFRGAQGNPRVLP